MTDPNASASMPFPDLWNAVIPQWISDDPQQPQFPAITQRQGALLDQIEPEVLAGHYMILKTTSRLVREEVETKLNAKICDVFSKKLGQDIQLSINIIEPTEPYSEATTSANSVPRSEAGTPQDSAGQVSRAQLAGARSQLPSLYRAHQRRAVAHSRILGKDGQPRASGTRSWIPAP